jgi:surface protein
MGCETLESIDLTSWDLVNVTSFHETFCDCGNLREIRFGGEANARAYSDTLDMFTGCVSLEYIFIPAEYQDTWNFIYNVEMPNDVQIITY